MCRRQGRDELITKLGRVIELERHAGRDTIGEQGLETTKAPPIHQNTWFGKEFEQNLLMIAAQAVPHAANGRGVHQNLDHVPRGRTTINIVTEKNLNYLLSRPLLNVLRNIF